MLVRSRVGLAAGLTLLSGCATTNPRPQQFRTFFLPPTPEPVTLPPIVEAPPLLANFFAAEVPNLSATMPPIPRPSDTEFLIRRADDRFAAGKKALQEGRPEDARREFNRSVEILLAAPQDTPERTRVEQRLQELVDSIYRYDTEELGELDAFKGGEPRVAAPGSVAGVLVREMIEPLGFVGGKTIVDHYLAGGTPALFVALHVQRTVYRPGEVCQFDRWHTGDEVPVRHGQIRQGYVVVAALGYSRVGAHALIFSRQAGDVPLGMARCQWSLCGLPKGAGWARDPKPRT